MKMAEQEVFEKLKENLRFLVPIFIGMVLSIVSMSQVISSSFEHYPIPTTLFFMGLVVGGIPMLMGFVKDKKEKKNIEIVNRNQTINIIDF